MTDTPHAPESKLWRFGQALPAAPAIDTRPVWQQADVTWIHAALQRAQALPGGGWYVLDASTAIGRRPVSMQVAGQRLVVWRARGMLHAAPEACPHMGACLADGEVRHGRLICPWHGLSLGPEGHGSWQPLPAHDDGWLAWVRLPTPGEALTGSPLLPPRPTRPLGAVVRLEIAAEPRDVLQNRLDPWHGTHFHPHSFASLSVIERSPDAITVRVAYRVAGRLCVEVDARFHCSDPRTIVMTIVRGEGTGSVVETHATPLARGRSAVIEATLATSDRLGFALARRASAWLRPFIARRALRLWLDDAAYAERLYALRRSGHSEDARVVPLRAPRAL